MQIFRVFAQHLDDLIFLVSVAESTKGYHKKLKTGFACMTVRFKIFFCDFWRVFETFIKDMKCILSTQDLFDKFVASKRQKVDYPKKMIMDKKTGLRSFATEKLVIV